MLTNKLNCFEIKNQTQESADIYIYGDIVSSEWNKWEDTDTCPEDIRSFLKEVENVATLNIYINSGGGSVFAGMAIYNMLKRHKGTKNVYVDGLAGSIASVIAMVGDKLYIPTNAFLMIHKAWNFTYGNSIELRKMADTLDTIDAGILEVYKTKLKDGIDIETVKQMIDEETWLTGAEAEEYFNIKVIEENTVAACVSENILNKYKNVPKNLNTQEEESENTTLSDSKTNDNTELLKAKLLLECEL